jgi:hypothetical protein
MRTLVAAFMTLVVTGLAGSAEAEPSVDPALPLQGVGRASLVVTDPFVIVAFEQSDELTVTDADGTFLGEVTVVAPTDLAVDDGIVYVGSWRRHVIERFDVTSYPFTRLTPLTLPPDLAPTEIVVDGGRIWFATSCWKDGMRGTLASISLHGGEVDEVALPRIVREWNCMLRLRASPLAPGRLYLSAENWPNGIFVLHVDGRRVRWAGDNARPYSSADIAVIPGTRELVAAGSSGYQIYDADTMATRGRYGSTTFSGPMVSTDAAGGWFAIGDDSSTGQLAIFGPGLSGPTATYDFADIGELDGSGRRSGNDHVEIAFAPDGSRLYSLTASSDALILHVLDVDGSTALLEPGEGAEDPTVVSTVPTVPAPVTSTDHPVAWATFIAAVIVAGALGSTSARTRGSAQGQPVAPARGHVITDPARRDAVVRVSWPIRAGAWIIAGPVVLLFSFAIVFGSDLFGPMSVGRAGAAVGVFVVPVLVVVRLRSNDPGRTVPAFTVALVASGAFLVSSLVVVGVAGPGLPGEVLTCTLAVAAVGSAIALTDRRRLASIGGVLIPARPDVVPAG